MKIILFSESESYYKSLGILEALSDYTLEFNGARLYKRNSAYFFKYAAFVSGFYCCPRASLIVIKCAKVNVKSIYLMDGIFEYSNALNNPMIKKYSLKLNFPILHDYACIVGRVEKGLFLESRCYQYLPQRVSMFGVKESKCENLILVTTANTAYFDAEERSELVDLLRAVCTNLVQNKVDFKIRIFDESILKVIGVFSVNDIESSFEDCIKDVTHVITTPSSISLTAMSLGLPVLHVDVKDTPKFFTGGWNIYSLRQVDRVLKSFLDGEKERILYQNEIVKNYLVEESSGEVLRRALEDTAVLSFKEKHEMISNAVNQHMLNLLNSSFNWNIEYFIRKVYLKIKSIKLVSALKKKIK